MNIMKFFIFVVFAISNINASYNPSDLLFEAIKSFQPSDSITKISAIIESDGADVNARDAVNNTPLFYAVKKLNLEMVQCLIRFHADINARNWCGQTVIHLITEEDCSCTGFEEVKNILSFFYLIDDADFNIQDDHGNTPLHMLAKRCLYQYKTALFNLLVDNYRVKTDIENHEGKTAFQIKDEKVNAIKMKVDF